MTNEYTPLPKMTFEEFKRHKKQSDWVYQNPMWKRLFRSYDPLTFELHHRIPNLYTIGVIFHFRVPGGDGYYNSGSWCFPWNWYKQYYEKRYLCS